MKLGALTVYRQTWVYRTAKCIFGKNVTYPFFTLTPSIIYGVDFKLL